MKIEEEKVKEKEEEQGRAIPSNADVKGRKGYVVMKRKGKGKGKKMKGILGKGSHRMLLKYNRVILGR